MADQSKKTRSELKSFFVPNAIPTANDFAAFIDAVVNQTDDGVGIDSGKLTVSGAIEGKSGLTVTGAPVTIGATSGKQPLTVNGALTVSDGLTVSTGTVSLNTSATISQQLIVNGQVNANANLAVTGSLTSVGGPVTIGDAGTNLAMTVHHSLTVNRDATLNKGLTVKGGSVAIGDSGTPQSITVSGTSNLQGGATILNGLFVPTGTVTFNGLANANGGLWVRGAALNVGEPTAKQQLNVNGVLNAQDTVNMYNGLNTYNQAFSANAGLNVWGGNMNVGTPSVNQILTVNGTVTVQGTSYAKTFQLAAPPGDPSPILTARAIPPNQGGSNEMSELIIHHGDDYGAPYGPDYITLRAPAIRLQTYASVGAPSVDNPGTSNTRFHIDPFGAMNATGTLTVSGLVTASAGLTVSSGFTTLNGALNLAQSPRTGTHPGSILGAYITADMADNLGVEIRHSNGQQGIGFGYNTIYATGSLPDQVLRLKGRGTSPVEVASNLNVVGTLSGAPNDYMKAQFTLHGGGTVTWVGGRLKWTSRFIAVSAGNSASTIISGYINIIMPTVDIPASNVWDGQARSVNASGLVLKPWDALYAVHTMGQNQDAVSFRVVNFSYGLTVPSNWLLIALMNPDENLVKLGTGQTLYDGGQVNLTGPLTAPGLITAQAGLSVTGLATVNGGLSIAQSARTGSHLTTIQGLYVTGDFSELSGVEFRHTTGTQGIGFGYNTIYATGSITDQPLRLKPRGASSVEVQGPLWVIGPATFNSVMTGPPNDYTKLHFTMSGGGTVTWNGTRLKWTVPFVGICAGISSTSMGDGRLFISMPTSDIPAANVYDGMARSADASGVLLNAWEALYAVQTLGGGYSSYNLFIVKYNVAHTVPSNWILVAVYNGNETTIKLGTGQIIYKDNAVSMQGSLVVTGPSTFKNVMTGPPNDYTKVQFTMSGGGIVTWSGNRLKWTKRFLGISAGSSSTAMLEGYVSVKMPTADLFALYMYDGLARSVDANGILLKSWEALYAVHGMGSYNDNIYLAIVKYDVPHTVPSNWLLVAVCNGDDNSLKLGNGQILQDGSAVNWSGPLGVGGLLSANAGLNVTGGPATVGTTAVNQNLTVNGTVQANTITFPTLPGDPAPVITARPIPLNQGPQGSSNEATELILFHCNDPSGTHAGPDCITLRAPELRLQTYNDTSITDINNPAGANTRLSIDSSGIITAFTAFNANAGLNVTGGPVMIGTPTANQALTVTGAINANNGVNVTNGGMSVTGSTIINTALTVNGSGLTVNAGGVTLNNVPLYVNNSSVIISPSSAPNQLLVSGTTMVNTLTFPPPPGDPSPVITARAIPTNQKDPGTGNEATELILFHSNDGFNGSGPDFITLRAPGLRFQCYTDASVSDINNPNGSWTRMSIEPTGAINMTQGLVRLGPQSSSVSNGMISACIGFMGTGVSHGQLAYRAGYGFELIDCSSVAPTMTYNRDSLPYTDLRLRQLQYQSQSQFSSRTLKEDIRDLSADEAMDAFQKLQPVTYRLKADTTGRTHAGFIAEDVPDLVSMDEHKAISPPDILAVLTRIVHTQQEAIRRLEAQIAALTPA